MTSITNDALAGAHPVALMTKAGHASMSTTKRYLKLAGAVFPDEAAALEARILGGASPRATNARSEDGQDFLPNVLPNWHDLSEISGNPR